MLCIKLEPSCIHIHVIKDNNFPFGFEISNINFWINKGLVFIQTKKEIRLSTSNAVSNKKSRHIIWLFYLKSYIMFMFTVSYNVWLLVKFGVTFLSFGKFCYIVIWHQDWGWVFVQFTKLIWNQRWRSFS